jgi:hypothetical protein
MHKLTYLFLFLLVVFVGGAQAHAQTSSTQTAQSVENASSTGEAITVATVNIYDAKIVSQDGNDITISFDISNREGYQPQVRYGVDLIQQNSDGEPSLLDRHVYDDTLSLGPNETVHKEITYSAPATANGTFQVMVVSMNDESMPLGVNEAGEVTLQAKSSAINIIPSSCYLTTSSDADSSTKYALAQGPDIKPTDSLMLHCSVTNGFGKPLSVTPSYATYVRTAFGKKVSEVNATSSIDITSTTHSLDLAIPLAAEPQAYDVEVVLHDTDGNTVSNTVTAHYVLQGASATIQSVLFDKDEYTAGDVAHLQLLWSGPADTFYSARGTGTDIGVATIAIQVEDGSGNACANTVQKQSPNTGVLDVDVPVTSMCKNPTAKVTITDAAGAQLTSGTFTVTTKQKPQQPETKPQQTFSLPLVQIILALVAVVIIVIVGILVMQKARRKGSFNDPSDTDDESGGGAGGNIGMAAILLLAVAGGFVGLVPHQAHADTFWVGYGGAAREYNVNINKYSYQPGESIRAHGWGWDNSCGNSYVYLGLKASTNGQSKTLFYTFGTLQNNSSNAYQSGTKYFTAPMTAGSYHVKFKGLGPFLPQWTWEWKSHNVPYIVVAPPVNGQCGAAADGTIYPTAPTSTLCSAGSASAATSSGSYWQWTCFGQDGGTDASCSAPRVPAPTPDIWATLPGSTARLSETTGPGGDVPYNTSVTLHWQVTNEADSEVNSCQATAGPSWWNGSKGYSGEVTMPTPQLLKDVDNIEITCTNPYNESGKDTTKINVNVPPVQTSIDNNPKTTKSGDDYKVTWDSQYAESCSVGYRQKDHTASSYPGSYTNMFNSTKGSTTTSYAPTPGTDEDIEWQLSCTNEQGTGATTTEHTVYGKPVVSIQICNKDHSGCQIGEKKLKVDEDASVYWSVDKTTTPISSCFAAPGSGPGFSPVGVSGGYDNSIGKPLPGDSPEHFQVGCTNLGGIGMSNIVSLSTESIPHLFTPSYKVPIGTNIPVGFYPNGGTDCSLVDSNGNTHYDATSTTPLPNGTTTVAINNTTTFTLSCDNGTHSITVFAQPIIHEQ